MTIFSEIIDSPNQGSSVSCLEHCPVNHRVMGLIPSQGTCPGYGFGPSGACARGSQSVFSPFPSLLFSLKSINISLGED